MSRIFVVVFAVFALGYAESALAQQATTTPSTNSLVREEAPKPEPVAEEEQIPGIVLPQSDVLHISLSSMAGYGYDAGNADKGFERQARVGNAIVTLQGRLNSRVSFLLSMSPVNEISPLPACSEPGFFRPNDPKIIYADLYADGRGPQIGCDPQGSRRVDMYRGIALDMLPQQGALREAYVKFDLPKNVYMQFGRLAEPVGFAPEEAGSWTSKDAPLIQRLNRDAYFTWRTGYEVRAKGMVFGGSASAIVGDSDPSKDYGYNKWFGDGSLDGNSGPGAIGEAYVRNERFDVRMSYRHNELGSKIESLAPSYWASGKHNDNAFVWGGKYSFAPHSFALAECAKYTVGLKASSALMVGSNPDPVEKHGCYGTIQVGKELFRGVVVGGSFTREEIDRADSLIRYLSENGLYGVTEGKKDRLSVVRIFVDLSNRVQLGFYRSDVSNPFPWVSGIYGVEGPNAFSGRSLNRWGMVVGFHIE